MNTRIKKKHMKMKLLNQSIVAPTMTKYYRLKEICPVEVCSPMGIDAAVRYFLRYNFRFTKRKRAIAKYMIAHNNDPGIQHPYLNYGETCMAYSLYYMSMCERYDALVPPLFLPA